MLDLVGTCEVACLVTMVKTDKQAGGLGENVTKRLDQLGMSRRELSRRARLSRQTIHNIEHEGNTNLKPSTFTALDTALKWSPGTALSYALGMGDLQATQQNVQNYLCRIAVHLSHMTTEQLELTLIMMEEHELGTGNNPTQEFISKVGELVQSWMQQVAELSEANHKHAS